MPFKLKDIFSKLGSKANKDGGFFKAPRSGGDIKKGMDWKYGHGEFAGIKKRRKPGESKFQYDVRMRKQGVKTADKPVVRTPEQLEGINPKSEIKGFQEQPPLWAQSDPLGVSSNPNDLTDKSQVQNFGIVPGMSFGEAFKQAGKGGAKVGQSTFFWTNPATGEEKTFLYDFEKKKQIKKI